MAIGGAINLNRPIILQEFCRRAGGSQGAVVIITTASGQPAESGAFYSQALEALGMQQTPAAINIQQRQDAHRLEYVEMLRQATGVFITGGNQVRLSATLGGTPVETALHAAFNRGAVIAGTSAGAAILSRVMLAFGKNGGTPRQRIAQFVPGFGLTDHLIFDQHFRQRDRLGRLLYAVANHPGVLGVGVDENTAAILEDDALTVFGQNAVTIVDGVDMAATDVAEIDGCQPVAISGVRLHVLTHGCVFDTVQRMAILPKKVLPVQ
jgi:cyanophycinase